MTARRAFAFLAAAWLSVALTEPMALHVCAMHDGTAVDGGHGGSHATAPATASDEHAAHQAPDHAPRNDAPAGSHACTCLGDCAGVAIASVPVAEFASFAPAMVRRDVAFPEVRIARVFAAGLRLPFATAPPILPS